MKIIVGLGNPGKDYVRTPHNIGFKTIDALAERYNCSWHRSFRFQARTSSGLIAGQPVLLVKPAAFMNNSGPVVAAIIRKKGITIQDMIVIADDADLPTGRMRIRAQGGSGGHKGLQSLLDCLAQDKFIRIRLGIGRSQSQDDLATHVLTPLPAAAWDKMQPMIESAIETIGLLLEHGLDAAMNAFNAPSENQT